MTLTDWVKRNGRLLTIIGIGSILIVEGTEAQYPVLPEWTGLAVLAGISVALAGWISAGRIYDMLPEEHGMFLVCFDADDDAGGAVWELSEDQFSEMEVHNGRLLEWSTSALRVYEVRSYDPSRNAAVANWRETASGSELAGHHTVSQAMDQVGELRDEFEKEAERAQFIRRRLPSIIRKLDRERAKDQARSLEPHLAPSTDSTAGVTDVLEESLPDELLPGYMEGEEAAERGAEAAERGAGDEGDGWASFDLLDDTESLEPTGANNAEEDE